MTKIEKTTDEVREIVFVATKLIQEATREPVIRTGKEGEDE